MELSYQPVKSNSYVKGCFGEEEKIEPQNFHGNISASLNGIIYQHNTPNNYGGRHKY